MSTLLMMSLMVGVSLTGNYNFFNVLNVGIAVCCLDDEHLHSILPGWLIKLLGLCLPIHLDELTEAEKTKQTQSFTFFGMADANPVIALAFWTTLVWSFKETFIEDVTTMMPTRDY